MFEKTAGQLYQVIEDFHGECGFASKGDLLALAKNKRNNKFYLVDKFGATIDKYRELDDGRLYKLL